MAVYNDRWSYMAGQIMVDECVCLMTVNCRDYSLMYNILLMTVNDSVL